MFCECFVNANVSVDMPLVALSSLQPEIVGISLLFFFKIVFVAYLDHGIVNSSSAPKAFKFSLNSFFEWRCTELLKRRGPEKIDAYLL